MFKNNPLFFYIFAFFFFNIQFLLQLLCFPDHTIKIVLSENTAFQKHS